jgi:ferrous iron transport protein A
MHERVNLACAGDGSVKPLIGSPLGAARRGFRGQIQALHVADTSSGLPADELERRLIELGFVEGASVEVLHEGPLGGDPIAVRVNDATVALRRREAMAILVI